MNDGCTCYHAIGGRKHDPYNPKCAIFSGSALKIDDDDDVTATPGCTCGFGGMHEELNERCALYAAPPQTALMSEQWLPQQTFPSLIINVDLSDMLVRYDGDEEKVIDFLTRLNGMIK